MKVLISIDMPSWVKDIDLFLVTSNKVKKNFPFDIDAARVCIVATSEHESLKLDALSSTRPFEANGTVQIDHKTFKWRYFGPKPHGLERSKIKESHQSLRSLLTSFLVHGSWPCVFNASTPHEEHLESTVLLACHDIQAHYAAKTACSKTLDLAKKLGATMTDNPEDLPPF